MKKDDLMLNSLKADKALRSGDKSEARKMYNEIIRKAKSRQTTVAKLPKDGFWDRFMITFSTKPVDILKGKNTTKDYAMNYYDGIIDKCNKQLEKCK